MDVARGLRNPADKILTDQPYSPIPIGETLAPEHSGPDVSQAWIVAGMLPALSGAGTVEVLAWSAALVVGAVVAHAHLLRWLAVGWIASAVIPGVGMVGVAAGGSMSHAWQAQLKAAALGAVLGLVPLPGVLLEAGPLLLVAACALAIFRRRE